MTYTKKNYLFRRKDFFKRPRNGGVSDGLPYTDNLVRYTNFGQNEGGQSLLRDTRHVALIGFINIAFANLLARS